MKLRTGRKLPFTVYIQMGDEPSDDDELLGMFLDPARAELTVQIANGERPPLADQEIADGHAIARRQIAGHGRDRYPTVLQQACKVGDEAMELIGALVEHAEIHAESCDYRTCSHINGEYADAGLALYELGNKLGLNLITCMIKLVDGDRRTFT